MSWSLVCSNLSSGLLMVLLTIEDVPEEGFGKFKREVAVEFEEVGAPEENEKGEAGFVAFFNPSELGFD